ncbi:MAG: hypothetical protein C4542_00225 [Dehalococcoidia bacterium]|nr:MAG: hypothetical protein C4542_00225 [Dehalococcoidia bacterium]
MLAVNARAGTTGIAAASSPRTQAAEKILKNLLNNTNYLPIILLNFLKSISKAGAKLQKLQFSLSYSLKE